MIFFILVALLAAYLMGKKAMDPKETGYDEDYREISFDDVGAPSVVRYVRSEREAASCELQAASREKDHLLAG